MRGHCRFRHAERQAMDDLPCIERAYSRSSSLVDGRHWGLDGEPRGCAVWQGNTHDA